MIQNWNISFYKCNRSSSIQFIRNVLWKFVPTYILVWQKVYEIHCFKTNTILFQSVQYHNFPTKLPLFSVHLDHWTTSFCMSSREVQQTQQHLEKDSLDTVTHTCIYFENHIYFQFSVYLWLLLHNSDSNRLTWDIDENSLLASNLLKFMLVLIYKMWHFSYVIFTFSSRFVLSYT